jgi:hypothetical protein
MEAPRSKQLSNDQINKDAIVAEEIAKVIAAEMAPNGEALWSFVPRRGVNNEVALGICDADTVNLSSRFKALEDEEGAEEEGVVPGIGDGGALHGAPGVVRGAVIDGALLCDVQRGDGDAGGAQHRGVQR